MNQKAKAKASPCHRPEAREEALMKKISGAAAVMMQVMSSMRVAAAVRSRLTSSSPLRLRKERTICGTRIALRTPPIIML